MKQLLLYLTIRRMVNRITDRADRSIATSVSSVTVRSVLTRVVLAGALPAADLTVTNTHAHAAPVSAAACVAYVAR